MASPATTPWIARTRARSLSRDSPACVRVPFETDTAALLARFKRREYVRIMLRDVLGIATLAETTAEISALSDVLIEEALREVNTHLQHRFGPPQRLDREATLDSIRDSPCCRWASWAATS